MASPAAATSPHARNGALRDRPPILPGPIAAFDVGGTTIKSGLVSPDGTVTHRATFPTPRDSGDPAGAVIDHIAGATRGMPGAVGVGVVVPGIVDDARGVGVVSTNLGWRNAQFREPLARLTGLPVGFNHDVTAAALAEAQFGVARGQETFAIIVIGTGIAAGLYVDGAPYRGNGYAGEIGHTIVDPAGPKCSCGARGCLEQFASASAIARRYAALSGRGVAGAEEVIAAMQAGDGIAAHVWQGAIDALAAGLRQLATSIAPPLVVIGGGLSRAGEALLAPLRGSMDASFNFYPVPAVTLAESGSDAGLLGSALIGARAVTG